MVIKKNTTKEVSHHEDTTKSTKKIDMSCCSTEQCASMCGKSSHVAIIALLVINTILLVMMFMKNDVTRSLEKFESMRVGGEQNQKLMKELYSLPSYQQDQNQKIQQALMQYKSLPNQAAPTTATGN